MTTLTAHDISAAKRIERVITRNGSRIEVDFDAYFDDKYLGTRGTWHAAECLIDDYVAELIRTGMIDGCELDEAA